MSVELVGANAVVIATQFNPSIVNQLWLVDNDLADRGEFLPGCIFTDALSNIHTRRFNLFVSPPQLQFVPLGEDPDGHQELVQKVVGGYVGLLPHTPYTAAGLNFTWHVRPEQASMAEFARGMFYQSGSAFFRAFDSTDARFGGYFSKDALGCRLKLDVKPVIALHEDEKLELMQFAFNFHRDIKKDERGADAIPSLLASWNSARELSRQIMKPLEETEG